MSPSLKIFVTFLLLFPGIGQCAHAQDTVTVNHTRFLFIKSVRPSEAHIGSDTILKVYRIQGDTSFYLLAHQLYAQSADCNSVFTDRGTYEIHGDSIIFLTDYAFEADKNFGLPFRRKQVYIVTDYGKMILLYDKEEYEDGWQDSRGN